MNQWRLAGYVALVGCLFALSATGALEVGAQGGARNPGGVAVIIGNGDYEHRDVPDVTFAHNDAEAFKRYVVEVLGYDPKNVIDVRDATRRRMYDVLGTRNDARSDLWSYLDPQEGSDVVVFYSGHGVPGQKDGRGYLLPVDADPKAAEDDGYPIDLLYRNLGGLREARRVQVFLDACFSGGSHEGGLIGSASPVYVKAAMPAGASTKVTSLTAATGAQIASWDERAKHGLFTHHLLDALYGKADSDQDGKITAAEAKQYLDDHMTRAARRAHRRVQEADLMGAEGVVLASAGVSGGFPKRLPLGGGKTTGKKVEKKVTRLPKPVVEEKPPVLDRKKKVQVQRGLASLGLYKGFIDGAFGPKTREAVRSWQRAKGYDETGRLTKDQADALAAVGGEAYREKAERERDAEERARAAKDAREKAETERRAREKAERDRLARERAEAEQRAREAAERKARTKCPEINGKFVHPGGNNLGKRYITVRSEVAIDPPTYSFTDRTEGYPSSSYQVKIGTYTTTNSYGPVRSTNQCKDNKLITEDFHMYDSISWAINHPFTLRRTFELSGDNLKVVEQSINDPRDGRPDFTQKPYAYIYHRLGE